MSTNTLSLTVCLSLLASTTLSAMSTDKVKLKGNMQLTYVEKPQSANSFDELFEKGIIYGRLRTQYLDFRHANEVYGKTANNSAWAVGGSLTYSTAYLNGFGATLGFYSSHTIDTDNIHYNLKGKPYDAGKVPRQVYDKYSGSGDALDVLAVSYIEYKFSKTNIKYGRQIFDSTIVHSNDVFMIPNTMEGVSLETRDIAKTRLRVGYFSSQKLMGHQNFHSIIATGDASNNDDSGSHKGLSVKNLNTYGLETDPSMAILSAENKSIKGLKLNFDAIYIDNFFYQIIPELNYRIALNSKWSISSGFRYFYQKDDGAGAVGGASISGKFALDKNPTIKQASSYNNIDSVDGSAWMARVVLSNGFGNVSFGYSSIDDKADLISPWRGFPTMGYSRDLTETNWYANTDSWMIRASYDLSKAGLVDGLFAQIDYASVDFDDKKVYAGTIAKTDSNIFHMDFIKTINSIEGLEVRLRLTWVDSDPSFVTKKDTKSYTDMRFEIDYLF